VKVGFGPISCQRHFADSRTDAEIDAEALDLASDAETLGFDSIWFAEHHFLDDSYLPSLLPMCAAAAARTSRILIGAGTIQAPFYNPLVLAEEAAVVDLLSNGRLIVSLGQGWRAEELDAFDTHGVKLAEQLERTVSVLRTGWSGDLLKDVAPVPVAVRPLPAQVGGPQIWFGSEQERAIRRAARMADGWEGTMLTPSEFGQAVAWILDEMQKIGRDPEGFTFSLHHAVFPWRDGNAWDLIRPHHEYFIWKVEDMTDSWGRTGRPQPIPASTGLDETWLRSLICAGTPEEVAEQICKYEEAAGVEIHFIARLYFPGLDRAIHGEAIHLFAQEVMPVLRKSS